MTHVHLCSATTHLISPLSSTLSVITRERLILPRIPDYLGLLSANNDLIMRNLLTKSWLTIWLLIEGNQRRSTVHNIFSSTLAAPRENEIM